MAIVHVYPRKDEIKHVTNGGASACWCEPEIKDFGLDSSGGLARVIVHQCVRELKPVGSLTGHGGVR